MPIYIWDEARLASNAIEMSITNDIIVTHYEGKPDLWNTKPPLLIWMQAGLIKLIGINELAIRLPSAIAGLITCFALFFFLKRHTKNYWFGFIAALVLVTSQGYVGYHGTRTGDYDALLILFITLFSFSFYNYLSIGKIIHFKLFFLYLTLAILTKGIQPLIFLPGLLLIGFLNHKDSGIKFQFKSTVFYSIFCIAVVAGYYFIRETQNPGYLKAVIENELGGRYLKTIESHDHGFTFYYDNILNKQFNYWYLPMFIGVFIGLLNKNTTVKKLSIFCMILTLFYFLVISCAQTKLEWYDLPIFPFMAILCSISIYELFLLVKHIPQFAERLKFNIAPYIILFFIFLFPYRAIIDKVYFPKMYDYNNESIPFILKNLPSEVKTCVICWDNGYGPQINFYITKLSKQNITCYYKYYKDLSPGDVAIASQEYEKEYIEANYKTTLLLERAAAKMYKIENRN